MPDAIRRAVVAGNGAGEGWASRGDVRDQVDLVDLGAAGDQGGDHRGSDAAADVAHEVDQAGDAAAFLRAAFLRRSSG